MANKFRSTSILRKYQKICSEITPKNITKTLLGLQKQKKMAMILRNLMDEEKLNKLKTNITSKGNNIPLRSLEKDSKISFGLTTNSLFTKTTDSKFLNIPHIALQRNVTNYTGNFNLVIIL